MYGHGDLLAHGPFCSCGRPALVEEDGVLQCAACALAAAQQKALTPA